MIKHLLFFYVYLLKIKYKYYGGNFVILTTKNDYYIDKDNFTIHFAYPPNKTNELDDKHLKTYLLECFEKFIKNKELELKLNKNLFDKLKI